MEKKQAVTLDNGNQMPALENRKRACNDGGRIAGC